MDKRITGVVLKVSVFLILIYVFRFMNLGKIRTPRMVGIPNLMILFVIEIMTNESSNFESFK